MDQPKQRKTWLLGGVFFALLLLPLLLGVDVRESVTDLQAHFLSTNYLTVVGILLTYVVKSIVMVVPNSVLYVAAGALLPFWLALLVSYVGLMLSLSVGYFTGKRLGTTKVYRLIAKQKKIQVFLEKSNNDLIPLCFIMRLLALPFGLLSFFFGALQAPFFKYLFVSLLGVTPVMIPVVLSGTAISDPFSVAFLLPFGISLLIVTTTVFLYKKATESRTGK